MKMKTFRAFTMAEALAAVKKQLGNDAVVLSTRSFKRGGLLGIGRRTVVEIVATQADEANPTNKPRRKPAPTNGRANAPAAKRAYAAANNQPQHVASTPPPEDTVPPVTEDDRQRTRALAESMLRDLEEKQRQKELDAKLEAAVQAKRSAAVREVKPIVAEPTSVAPPAPDVQEPLEPVAKRFKLSVDEETKTARTEATTDAPKEAAEKPVQQPTARKQRAIEAPAKIVDEREEQSMQDELHAIRGLVGQVLQHQVSAGGKAVPAMPQRLFDIYLKLVANDLSEELADRIINDVRDELRNDQLSDETLLHEAVCRHLADYIPCADVPVPLESPDDRPLTISLVGPTGVGKTTTLAKLAATFKLHHQRRVGLITSDTYRIAAVDQLRTYANIIGLSLEVVLTPSEMTQAIHTLGDCDVILIDTAGRGQNDEDRITELGGLLEAADPHEVHLVLSSTASEKVLMREAEAFAAVGIDKIVFTKLDEAVSFGMLVNVARQVGKELSFFTTGQEVPDHIERGQSQRLATLVLDGEAALASSETS